MQAAPLLTRLSTHVASPLTTIGVFGAGFDSSVVVRFFDDADFLVDVRPMATSSVWLEVVVPSFVDATGQIGGAANLHVAVLRRSGAGLVSSGVEALMVTELPRLAPSSEPGRFATLEILRAAESFGQMLRTDLDGTSLDFDQPRAALDRYLGAVRALITRLEAGSLDSALGASDRLLVAALRRFDTSDGAGADAAGAQCLVGEAARFAASSIAGTDDARALDARELVFAVRASALCAQAQSFNAAYERLATTTRALGDLLRRRGERYEPSDLPLVLARVALSATRVPLAVGGAIAQSTCEAQAQVRGRVRELSDVEQGWAGLSGLEPEDANPLAGVVGQGNALSDALLGAPPPSHCGTVTFSVDVGGDGHGAVAVSPPGGRYLSGRVVHVSVAPDSESTVVGWPEGCASARECSVTLDSSTTIAIQFSLKRFLLTLNSVGEGTGSITTSTPDSILTIGSSVTLTAVPARGSTFTGWAGDCAGMVDCTLTMDAPKSVVATFALAPSPFDGAYSGSFSGTALFGGSFSYGMRGVVAFSVVKGMITVAAPGTGAGAVSREGSGTFTTAGGTVGRCAVTGTFSIDSDVSSASGTYVCTIPGGTSSGSWTATR